MSAAVAGAAAVIRPHHGGRSLQVSQCVACQDWLSKGVNRDELHYCLTYCNIYQ